MELHTQPASGLIVFMYSLGTLMCARVGQVRDVMKEICYSLRGQKEVFLETLINRKVLSWWT